MIELDRSRWSHEPATPRLDVLEAIFEAAWSIVSRLPSPIPHRAVTAWPEVPPGWGDYASAPPKTRPVRPDPSEIDPAVEIVHSWPQLVRRDMCRRTLFAKATGYSYRTIADLDLAARGVSHETIRRWHREALSDIAASVD